MKKALIPALLVLSTASAPCLRGTAELPCRVSEFVTVLVSPLLWQLREDLPARQFARWNSVSQFKKDPESRPELRNNSFALLFFQVVSKRHSGGHGAGWPSRKAVIEAEQTFSRRRSERVDSAAPRSTCQ